mmetsp:Transcript_15318/g.23262  ORF Transcript_15318/g.23262 Transcript_15318/m.23262 type:complete len:512 (+) Transcript_15318:29-1564(+)
MAPSDNNDNDNPPLAILRSLPREARNLLAGGLAGMLAKSVVAPIDRIKILYQVTSAQFRLGDVPKVASSIIEKEGWAALWKGNTATMIRVFPYSGIQFMVFDYCKVYFLGEKKKKKVHFLGVEEKKDDREITKRRKLVSYNDDDGREALRESNIGRRTISHRGTVTNKGPIIPGGNHDEKKAGLTPVESLISGMTAGAVSSLCTYPLDMARAQLAVLRKQKKPTTITATSVPISSPLNHGQLGIGGASSTPTKSKKGILHLLTQSFQRSGLPGLYRGITPTILGILPYSGVAFTINEQAKRRITTVMGREPTTMERLQCGALSGLFAQTLAYPLEVTRRRMQTIGIVPTSGSESAAVNFAGVSAVRPCVDEMGGNSSTGTTTTSSSGAIGKSSESVGQRILNGGSSNNGTAMQQPQQQQQQQRKPPSMRTTMLHLFEEQGIRGFYKGVSMNWVKGPIAFSISFTTFDTLQRWMRSEEERERMEDRGGSGYARAKSSKVSISRRLTNNEDGD